MKIKTECPRCKGRVLVSKSVLVEATDLKQIRVQSVTCKDCKYKGSASSIIEYRWP